VGWPAAVTAIATAVLALCVLILTVGIAVTLRRFNSMSDGMTRLLEALDRDARPALDSVRRTAEEASRVAVVVRAEVEGFAGASHRLRDKIEHTAGSLEERFVEFETLLDVLQEELEETVLDVASVLRTTRRGSGFLRAAKRAVLGRRRR
jgi:uncharacterized protein YoxC